MKKSIPILKAGKTIITADPDRLRKFTSLLHRAAAIASVRAGDYGHPRSNFSHISSIASAILKKEITPRDICVIMIATKLSREIHKHKKDNLVDIVGYAQAWSLIEGEK